MPLMSPAALNAASLPSRPVSLPLSEAAFATPCTTRTHTDPDPPPLHITKHVQCRVSSSIACIVIAILCVARQRHKLLLQVSLQDLHGLRCHGSAGAAALRSAVRAIKQLAGALYFALPAMFSGLFDCQPNRFLPCSRRQFGSRFVSKRKAQADALRCGGQVCWWRFAMFSMHELARRCNVGRVQPRLLVTQVRKQDSLGRCATRGALGSLLCNRTDDMK
jgi:hypothetical protein